jgi:hypothetical protein
MVVARCLLLDCVVLVDENTMPEQRELNVASTRLSYSHGRWRWIGFCDSTNRQHKSCAVRNRSSSAPAVLEVSDHDRSDIFTSYLVYAVPLNNRHGPVGPILIPQENL